ncbi:MAG: GIY-YIG nuclease family protein [Candidatus Kapaibacteriales bacterium]
MNFLLRNSNQNNSGLYQLYIVVSKPTKITLTKFGDIIFPKGLYIYTGSAKKNLLQRINRHLKTKEKKTHWHIDFLLTSEQTKIIRIKIIRNRKQNECKINLQTQKDLNGKIIIEGFGSSDCNKCKSHLLYISESSPDLESRHSNDCKHNS